jgi:hypothetical protein
VSPEARAEAIRAAERALSLPQPAEALAQLGEAALGAHLYALYLSVLLEETPALPAARASWVGRLLQRWNDDTRPPRRVFEAEVLAAEVRPQGHPPLSRAEALSARAWGIGFGQGGVPDLELEAEHRRAQEISLARDLRGVGAVARALGAPRALNPEGEGRDLERLVADCLALRWRVDAAPLIEDVLEQTDLRVRVPGASKRGVRVQVAATIQAAGAGDRHDRKAARAQQGGVVLVSPLTLAAAVPTVPGAAAALPAGGPAVLSRALRDRLFAAMARATAQPRGPLAQLAPALVNLVCAVVLAGSAQASGPARRHRRSD